MHKSIGSVLIAVLLAACGGGDGSDNDPQGTSAETFQVGRAATQLVTKSSNWSASADYPGGALTLDVGISAVQAAQVLLDGEYRYFFDVSRTLRQGKNSLPTSRSTVAVIAEPFTILGLYPDTLPTTPSVPIQATAKVGDSGILFVSEGVNRRTWDWSLEPNKLHSAHFCIRLTSGAAFDKYCFTISPAGDTLGWFQAIASDGAQTLHFR